MEEKFEDTVSFNGERYSVQLPWKSDRVNLQTNRSLCERRLNAQLKRLKKEPEILMKYDDVIKDQINRVSLRRYQICQLEKESTFYHTIQ